MNRALPVFLMVLALAIFASAPLVAAEVVKADTHDGKVVSITGNKLVMADQTGKNLHTHILANDAKVTCNGKDCKLTDLKPGMFVRVTTKKGDIKIAVRVDARKKADQ